MKTKPIELRPGMILGIDPTTGDLCELPIEKKEPEVQSLVEAARRVVDVWVRDNLRVPVALHDTLTALRDALERVKP